MILIDGKKAAAELRGELKLEVSELKKNLIKFSGKLFPKLDVIKYPIKKEPKILTEIVP